jgi:hypothetical protein
MFETEEFRQQIANAINSETRRLGFYKYQIGIDDYLQNLAVANERDDLPFLRGYSVQTAYRVAMQSVTILIGLAVEYVRERGDTALMLEDVQKTYRAGFCRFWPFCK